MSKDENEQKRSKSAATEEKKLNKGGEKMGKE
jgi:hypothetical protein